MPSGGSPSAFDNTHWSLVSAARGDDPSAARRALAELCQTYRPLVYDLICRQGCAADEADDLTQSFFLLLLERNDVQGLRRERGLFRSFLRASLRHFLMNDAVRRRALKRGGGEAPLSLEAATAGAECGREPADPRTPDVIFERQWALTTLDRVFERLRNEWKTSHQAGHFDYLRGCLLGDLPPGGYETVAAELGVTPNAARVTVHRLKRRFRRYWREAIAATVLSEEDIEGEMRHLFNALRGDL